MIGLDQVFSNFIGGINVAQYTMFDYQQLVIICSCIFIIVSVVITCIAAREEQFRKNIAKSKPFVQIFRSFKSMPKPVLHIHRWMG
ncbi:hypothetical protein TVAG_386520 [Trichomonas vaginalis G3]|uniref:Uncharacterized protein n=1 Tax=Trichomonas vaginalis (strain ATCC PRA-98 / G3) TaxID=412133 RepID=A2FSE9_TRIV3|nr:sucrose transmembrane transporter protein [Trichomonas vaginalis G3]EAX92178.1 hypothetical protein TVAG_386520 [Trichomonas vaginalis G3]KAI5547654.1 sucrose transmembrane transporter protein [Trichomonas vaginalis G3]|eukprot:XP_001305108.1 hypothetical protein [Trichomonas vaginalis G3]